MVDGRDADALRRAVADLPGVLAVLGDVADPEHRARLLKAAGGELDLLVNNASSLGPTPLPPLRSYPLDELRGSTRSTSSRRSPSPSWRCPGCVPARAC